jgi:Protein of unknown function (DUF1566)
MNHAQWTTWLIGLIGISSTAHATCPTNVVKLKPDSRYEVVAGATPAGSEVRDKVTGLIWQRCMNGMTWNGSTCTGVAATANWKTTLDLARLATPSTAPSAQAWRVPSYAELISLTDRSCYAPAINETWFPATSSGPTWTSSPSSEIEPLVFPHLVIYTWGVSFSSGNSFYYYGRANTWPVRFVR